MHTALGLVMTSGPATASNAGTVPRGPLIGKTGTTDGSKDTWMVGASTEVATVAAVVSVNGQANQRGLSFATGSAATARHRMWPAVMSVASAKYGGGAFSQGGLGPVAEPGSQPASGSESDQRGESGGGQGGGPGQGNPGGGPGQGEPGRPED